MQISTARGNGTARLTNGSNYAYASAGVDWGGVGVGAWFNIVADGVVLDVIAAPVQATLPGSSPAVTVWRLSLSAAFEGVSNTAATYIILKDFGASGEPIFAHGDTETMALRNRSNRILYQRSLTGGGSGGTAAVLPTGPLISSQQTSGLPKEVVLPSEIVIATNDAYNAFPDAIKDRRGRLQVYYHSSSSHTSTDGVIKRAVSKQGGRAWTTNTLALPANHVADVHITMLPSGRLALSYSEQISGSNAWIMFSDDDGETWTAATKIASNVVWDGTWGAICSNLCATNDGVIYAALYGHLNSGDAKSRAMSSRSTDGGATWSTAAPLSGNGTTTDYSEPVFVRNAQGRLELPLRAFVRDDTAGKLMTCTSTDGLSWSSLTDVTPASFVVGEVDAVRVGNALYLTYRGVSSIRHAVSYDDTATWETEEISAAGYYEYSCTLYDNGLLLRFYGQEVITLTTCVVKLKTYRVGNYAVGLDGSVIGKLTASAPAVAGTFTPDSYLVLYDAAGLAYKIPALAVGSTVFTPTDYGTVLVWYQAELLSGADSDPISPWSVSHGTANNLTQSGTARPLLKTAVVNGKKVVRFDGVNDSMNFATALSPTNCTIFAVMNVSATTASDMGFLSRASVSTPFGAIYFGDYSGVFSGERASFVGDPGSPGPRGIAYASDLSGWHVYAWRLNGTTETFFIDGVAVSTSVSSLGHMDSGATARFINVDVLGKFGTGSPLLADIRQFGVMSAALSDGQVAAASAAMLADIGL